MLAKVAIVLVVVLCLVQQGDAWFWRRRRGSSCSRVDCTWGSWGKWGNCRNGRQSRTRTVTRAQTCGGVCHGSNSESRDCPKNELGSCLGRMCGSGNVLRTCDFYGCGHYNAPRGKRLHKGVDLKCLADANVHAPFDGKIVRLARPYKSGKSCCNKGILIRGTGTSKGWEMKIFYVKPKRVLGQAFKKGDTIARHVSLHCSSCYKTKMTDHIHIQLYKGSKKPIDPTPHVVCNSP